MQYDKTGVVNIVNLAFLVCYSVLSGNSSSLFDSDRPEDYKPRLLHFCMTRDKSRIEVTEVPISKKSLNNGDVYIYDEGIKMTQWNGSRCDEEERVAVGGRCYFSEKGGSVCVCGHLMPML